MPPALVPLLFALAASAAQVSTERVLHKTGADALEASPVEVAGERTSVWIDFGGEPAALVALDLAERAWTVAEALIGPARPRRHHTPRPIRIYRTEATYARAESELTGGFFRGNLSFSHWKSRSSHIALQPPVAPTVFAAHGLPYQTQRLVAHEAAHLAVFESFENFRYHPFWFAEGVAQWVEARVVVESGLAESVEADPFFSQYLSVGLDLARDQDLPRLELLLQDAWSGEDEHTKYALAWLAVEFLSEPAQRPTFRRMQAVLRDMPPGPDAKLRFAERVERDLGTATLRRLGDEFERWIPQHAPVWRETARSLETAGPEWVHLGFPGRGGLAWRAELPPAEGFTVLGAAQVLSPVTGELSILLAQSERGFLSVVLFGGGVVEVHAWEQARADWKRLAGWTVAGVDFSRATPFRVDVGDEALVVTVGGAAPRRVEVAGWNLKGAWGLGVGASAAGVWNDVRVIERE